MSDKRLIALNEFAYLWKVNDAEWIARRKQEWRYLAGHAFKTSSAAERKEDAEYFVYGRLNGYMNERELFILTPIDSAETANRLFCSDVFSAHERGNLMSSFIGSASDWGEGMPWQKEQIRYFVEGVLGDTYRVLEEHEGRFTKVYSPNPTSWCESFAVHAIEVLRGEREYHGYIEAVDYFMSALRFVIPGEWRMRRYTVDDVLVAVDEAIASPTASETAKAFAQKLKAREQAIRDSWALAHLNTGR